MALRAGRVGVAPDQVDGQGKIIGGGSPGPTPPASEHAYSLTEQPIGKWIDGKTIYEKVVRLSENQGDTGVDIDTLIYLDARGTDSGNLWTIAGVTSVDYRYMYYQISSGKIFVNGTKQADYAIIQYTKKEES